MEIDLGTDTGQKLLQELDTMVSQALENVVNRVIVRLFHILMDKSPIVTGTYAANHKIDNHGGSPQDVFFADEIGWYPGLARAMSEAISRRNYKWSIKDSTIYFYNPVNYADQVEHIGWPEFGKPPYYVYTVSMAMFNALVTEEVAKEPLLEWLE